MVRLLQAKFNPAGDYVARRAMLINGQRILPGDLVTGLVSDRKLRQLYETRKVMKGDPATIVDKDERGYWAEVAENFGIKVDGRWGVKRIRKAIQDAKPS